jgi:hypothetical protein
MKFFTNLLLRFLPCAFDAAGMNRIQAGSKTLWLYEDPAAIATIIASGYFNAYTDYLRQGDQILISAGIGGTVTRDSAVVSSVDNAATVTLYVKT